MDIRIFSEMLKDKHFCDYKKMKYKYNDNFDEYLNILTELYYKDLPLLDFDGTPIVFVENHSAINQNTLKRLLQPQEQTYGIKAAENEIIATSSIENIDFSRDSVRRILKGMSPKDEQEDRILGIKKGMDFISDIANKITEENFHKLYMMTVGDFLSGDDKLESGSLYRHDNVFVVSDRVEHSGLDWQKVSKFMKLLIDFANEEDELNDLIKASVIHFYIAYVHPYFDGNGRMARLVHLWFLVQKGYRSALFIPFSDKIAKSRKAYYEAYNLIEKNKEFIGKLDVTPFIMYFTDNVYDKIDDGCADMQILSAYDDAAKAGKITEKEAILWKFVLSFYGTGEFSTKQLEKDFGNAAYATIRAFVLKFEKLGLLFSVKYGTRVKYKVCPSPHYDTH